MKRLDGRGCAERLGGGPLQAHVAFDLQKQRAAGWLRRQQRTIGVRKEPRRCPRRVPWRPVVDRRLLCAESDHDERAGHRQNGDRACDEEPFHAPPSEQVRCQPLRRKVRGAAGKFGPGHRGDWRTGIAGLTFRQARTGGPDRRRRDVKLTVRLSSMTALAVGTSAAVVLATALIAQAPQTVTEVRVEQEGRTVDDRVINALIETARPPCGCGTCRFMRMSTWFSKKPGFCRRNSATWWPAHKRDFVSSGLCPATASRPSGAFPRARAW